MRKRLRTVARRVRGALTGMVAAIGRGVRAVGPRAFLTFGGLAAMGAAGWLLFPPAGLAIVGAGLFYLGALHPLVVACALSRANKET